jgi:hypothetical protein
VAVSVMVVDFGSTRSGQGVLYWSILGPLRPFSRNFPIRRSIQAEVNNVFARAAQRQRGNCGCSSTSATDEIREQGPVHGGEDERPDPEVQREGNDRTQVVFHSPTAHPVIRLRAGSENVRLAAGFGTCPITTRMKRCMADGGMAQAPATWHIPWQSTTNGLTCRQGC